ncbi:TIGR01777 family oxidoreductase [Thiomicrorhabdus cannonii]|uniref:TIGR01777 family oxidoreductase n=1 Tax=Thiomicrorhabdus cannonii TaxID=2748011 RepID=UPI0015B8C185|nr:TIGR01777 family oxidoreductase [Thiomicrorhabdus cannonii]
MALAQQNILILGGTGFIGRHLRRHLREAGHQVEVMGREAFSNVEGLAVLLEGRDLLIMLAGANVGQRWTAKHKRDLWDSRLNTNAMLAEALARCAQPPARIFSASAIGIYPQNDCTAPCDESCDGVDDSELGRLGAAWEAASRQLVPAPLIFRFGVVLGTDGGALAKMLPAFKLGLGGPVAGGKQCFSWVHIDDLCAAMLFALEQPQMQGVYNLCAPQPLSNAEFGRTLAEVLHRPFWLPLPAWQLRLLFGEGAQVLTHSAAVVPARLLRAGFQFRYASAQAALADLLG